MSPILLPSTLCPLSATATKTACLQATVQLLLTLLIKTKIQMKAASAQGLFLPAVQTLFFLGATGALGLVVACSTGRNSFR